MGSCDCQSHKSGKTGIGKALPRQWEFQDPKMKGSVPYKALFCGDIPLHCHIMTLLNPYISLLYRRYLKFRIVKWLLK